MRSEARTNVITTRGLSGAGRIGRGIGMPSVAGAWVASVLLCLSSGPAAAAAEPLDENDAQFMAFLEYLGSWDGAEDQWTDLIEYVEPGEPGVYIVPEEADVDTVLSFTGRMQAH
jgi:hypothetical protein